MLNRSTLNIIYLTLIRPLLEYADFLFDGCTQECSDALESIQYDAAHLVTLLDELSWDTPNPTPHSQTLRFLQDNKQPGT